MSKDSHESVSVHRNPLLVPDIVSHVLLPMLDDLSVIVLSCTSSIHWNLRRSRILHSSRWDLIRSLYYSRPLSLLRWFNDYLRYPIFSAKLSSDWIHRMTCAARGCNWELIRHFIPPRFHHDEVPLTPSASEIAAGAASCGDLDLLRYLRDSGLPWGEHVYNEAAKHGHLAVLQYALENNCPLPKDDATACAAARGNHFEIVKWLHTKGFLLGDSAVGAASANNLEMLQWIIAQGGVTSAWVASAAVSHSNIAMLRRLISNRCPLSRECASTAFAYGSIECLQILRDAGCPWDEHSLHKVVPDDHADILVWALDRGCPIDKSLLPLAARNGAYKVLDVLFDRSVPYDPRNVWCSAVESHSVKVLRYLRDQRNVPGLDLSYIASFAAYNGDIKMVQWAFEQKGKVKLERVYEACDGNPVAEAVLQWLKLDHPRRQSKRQAKRAKKDESDSEESSEESEEEQPAKDTRQKRKTTTAKTTKKAKKKRGGRK